MKITTIESTQDSIILQTIALLICYSFEVKGQTTDQIVKRWVKKYTPIWLRLATIEALYLGRYKAVSVEQILRSWRRTGNPSYHFNHDFERFICRKLPGHLQNIKQDPLQQHNRFNNKSCEDLKKPIQFSQPIIPETETEKQGELLRNARELNRNLPIDSSATSLSQRTKQRSFNLEKENFKMETKRQEKKTVVPYKPNWISTSKIQKSIDRFTPLPDRSQFYLKLKAVAQQNTNK